MEEKTVTCAAELRKMAESCRRLAGGLSSPALARQLEEIAEDYERDADRFDARYAATIRSSFLNKGAHSHP